MSQNRDQLLDQIQGLNTALTALLDQLGRIESEVTEAKSEAANQITAVREFLNNPQISSLAGPDPAAGAELAHANQVVQKLSVGQTQEQILEIFLEELKPLAARAILFLRRGDNYTPWKSLGFEGDVADSVPVREGDPVQRSAEQRQIIYRTDNLLEAFPWLGDSGAEPSTAVCLPLVFDDFTPLVLYVDSTQGIELDSLELLSHLAVLVLKNHYLTAQLGLEPELRQAVASPAPPYPSEEEPEEEEVEEVGQDRPESQAETGPERPSVFASPPPAAEPSISEAEREEEVEEALEEIPEIGDVAPASSDEVETGSEPGSPESDREPEESQELPSEMPLRSSDWSQFFEPPRQEEDEEPVESAEEEEAEGEAEDFDRDEVPSLESLLKSEQETEEGAEEAPPPTPPAAAPPSEDVPVAAAPEPELDEETQRKHEEAKRFARLLVSEIKLYHEDAVNQGRQHHDLYERLRKDIDRSREMYERRADSGVRASQDYFHSEVVRILAEGNESVLGDEYPGPHQAH